VRFAVVGLVIFVTGGVVGAVVQPLLRARVPALEPPVLAPTKTSAAAHGARRRSVPKPTAVEASTVPEPPVEVATASEVVAAPPVPAPSAPSPRSNLKPVPIRLAARQPALEAEPPQPAPPVTPVSAPTPAPQPGETALISAALGKLRTSHEPAAALAVLDEYRARFPGGVLEPEAARLRTEALLLLGRKATVLDELDRALPGDVSAGDERVVRGELRAAAGRWQAALADFDAVVRAHPNGGPGGAEVSDRRVRDRLERALWGRASSHSHLGDDDAVCADLGEYFRRFPHGRFAAQAKQLLDKVCEP
jgi:hypothetical protein